MDITIDADSAQVEPCSGHQVCATLSTIDEADLYSILKDLEISKIVEALDLFDLLEEIGEEAAANHFDLEKKEE